MCKKHYEYEIIELMGLDDEEVEHCSSCHSDEEMGYSSMPEYDIPELGKEHFANLCCKVGEKYKEWHNKECT